LGAKYTTNTVTGFNSGPPPDDGTQTAANLIEWSGIKTKLADPIKNQASDIDTDLVAAFDYAVRQISVSDSLVAVDHMRTVEIAPTATTGVTVTLADAATMTNIYRVYIKNSSPHEQTIARATGGDTIDGVAASIKIQSGSALVLTTNNAASGYLIAGAHMFPFTDSNPIVVGSSDATKKVRFEVDGLTTATTRVMTVPDADTKIGPSVIACGRNIAARTNSGTPNSKIDITADELLLKDSNGLPFLASTVSVTVDITASGANGLDTAAEASSTWYYGWVIAKPDGTTAGLISASATAPTMPSGYTFKALVSAVRNDGSSNFVKYRQRGNSVYYEAGVSVLGGGTASVETAITITSVVPPIALAFSAFGNCTGAADVAGNWGGSPTLRVVSGSDFLAAAYQIQGLVNTAAAGNSVPIPELPNISQTLLYLVTATAGSASLTVVITGFKLPMGGE